MKSRIISLGLVASLVCLLPQVADCLLYTSDAADD